MPSNIPVLPEDKQQWGCLRFRITCKGKATSGWGISRCTLEDAGGNILRLWRDSITAGEEEIVPLRGHFIDGSHSAVLPHSLWPGETAWRVSVVLKARSNADFLAEELYHFPRITVPGEGQILTTNVKINVKGGAVVLKAIHGKGSDPAGTGVQLTNGCVVTTGSTLSENYSFAITKVVDEEGRFIRGGPFQNYVEQMDPADFKSLFPLDILPSSKTLDITIGVTTNRFASFIVLPPKFPSPAKK